MNTQVIVRQIRNEQWKQQIDECIASGKSVREWCEENALSPKTYYYRLKRVREFTCESLEIPAQQTQVKKSDTVFAELRPPVTALLAITLKISNAELEIHNGADAEVIENTIRALKNIC